MKGRTARPINVTDTPKALRELRDLLEEMDGVKDFYVDLEDCVTTDPLVQMLCLEK